MTLRIPYRQDRRASAAILLVVLGAAAACSPAPQKRPNILLVTLDTTRADHLGAYGYTRANTPTLDRLAANGVLFERAISAAPLTLPAHVSLLTGQYPFTHGVRNNGNFTLGDTTPTLATAFRAAGYRTAAFVSAFVLDHRYGLARGFDRYDDRLGLERRGGETATAAEAWLRETAGDARPFFLWVHLYDPHDPYDPPPPFAAAFADRPYDGEIAYDDDVVGRLLQHADGGDGRGSTIVVVAGDHGESLGDHGEETHGLFVYESTIRVPLIIAGGALPAGRRVSELVRTIDLAPTLLDLAGAGSIPSTDGRSLRPLVDHRGAGPQDAYSETYFPQLYMNWAPLRTLQDARWKVIDAPVPELYDLANDGAERANLAAREAARTAAMRQAVAAAAANRTPTASVAQVDRETAQKLAALGYIGAAAARAAADDATRPDPKAMIDVFNALRAANAAIQRRQFAAAEASARRVLARDGDNAFATMVLARAELEQGRLREAAADYRRYAILVPTSADAHHWRAICLSRLGEADRAIAEEDAALALDANDAEARELRGGLLAARGRMPEALADLRGAVALAPDNALFQVGLARVLLDGRDLDDADRAVTRALHLQPDDPDVLAASGSLLAARSQWDAARIAFERSLARRPDADDVRLDYAGVLDRLGRRTDARAEYRRLANNPEAPESVRRSARERLR